MTYYRRHKGRALLLLSLVTLVTLAVYLMAGWLNSYADYLIATVDEWTRYSLVLARRTQSVEPAVVSQIRTQPDVDQVIPAKQNFIYVPALGKLPFFIWGVSEANLQTMLQVCDLRLKEGRLPTVRTNEVALSEQLVRAFGLRLGDKIGRSINKTYFADLPTELVLVGILEGDPSASGAAHLAPGERQVGSSIRVGLASYEYFDSHEMYALEPTLLIVVPKQGHKAAADSFLQSTIRSGQVFVSTYQGAMEIPRATQQVTYVLLGFVDCVVAFVMAQVAAAINQIALTQRLEEFGLLHAIGQDKRKLVRRATLETTVLAALGWLSGLALAGVTLIWIKTTIYEPSGLDLNLASFTPLWFTLPIPLLMIALANWSIGRVLARLDAIAIIERGQLGTEAHRQRAAKDSSANPLSAWTFYVRHRRRGVMLMAIMALMVLGVAVPVFAFSPMQGAHRSIYAHLRHWSVVYSVGGVEIDPGLAAQIRTASSVARVIPAHLVHLSLTVPPMGNTGMWVYSVSEDDLPYALGCVPGSAQRRPPAPPAHQRGHRVRGGGPKSWLAPGKQNRPTR